MFVARLSLAGAALLLASLFFTWVKLPLFAGATGTQATTGTQAGATSLDGWTVLESGDTLLLLIAFVAIGLVVSRSLEGPWLLILAAGAAAVVVSFLFSGVPMTEVYEQVYSDSGYSYGADKGVGVWIAAGGTFLLMGGGVIQAREWLSHRPGARRPGPGGDPADQGDSPGEPGSAAAADTRRARRAGRYPGRGDESPERGTDPTERRRRRR